MLIEKGKKIVAGLENNEKPGLIATSPSWRPRIRERT